jgi:hypothetical protein
MLLYILGARPNHLNGPCQLCSSGHFVLHDLCITERHRNPYWAIKTNIAESLNIIVQIENGPNNSPSPALTIALLKRLIRTFCPVIPVKLFSTFCVYESQFTWRNGHRAFSLESGGGRCTDCLLGDRSRKNQTGCNPYIYAAGLFLEVNGRTPEL